MKSALFIIVSCVVVSANAEGADRVVVRHQDTHNEEGLKRVAESSGAKLRGAVSNQRKQGDNAHHRARILTGSMSMSVPIFEAEASISMPTRFIVPAEFSLSMPEAMPAALEDTTVDKEAPKMIAAKAEKEETLPSALEDAPTDEEEPAPTDEEEPKMFDAKARKKERRAL